MVGETDGEGEGVIEGRAVGEIVGAGVAAVYIDRDQLEPEIDVNTALATLPIAVIVV